MSWVETRTKRFQLQAGESLLEGLERIGLQVEYQCRSGYCGACRTRLIAGQVRYRFTPLAHLNADEILPCCCVPCGNVVLDL